MAEAKRTSSEYIPNFEFELDEDDMENIAPPTLGLYTDKPERPRRELKRKSDSILRKCNFGTPAYEENLKSIKKAYKELFPTHPVKKEEACALNDAAVCSTDLNLGALIDANNGTIHEKNTDDVTEMDEDIIAQEPNIIVKIYDDPLDFELLEKDMPTEFDLEQIFEDNFEYGVKVYYGRNPILMPVGNTKSPMKEDRTTTISSTEADPQSINFITPVLPDLNSILQDSFLSPSGESFECFQCHEQFQDLPSCQSHLDGCEWVQMDTDADIDDSNIIC